MTDEQKRMILRAITETEERTNDKIEELGCKIRQEIKASEDRLSKEIRSIKRKVDRLETELDHTIDRIEIIESKLA